MAKWVLIITRTGCLARRSLNCLKTQRTCALFFSFFFYYTITSLFFFFFFSYFVSFPSHQAKKRTRWDTRDSLNFKAESREGWISRRTSRYNKRTDRNQNRSLIQIVKSKFILCDWRRKFSVVSLSSNEKEEKYYNDQSKKGDKNVPRKKKKKKEKKSQMKINCNFSRKKENTHTRFGKIFS